MPTTSKWGLPYPADVDIPDVPLVVGNLATSLDDVAKDSQGLLSARPAATTSGRYYTATDDLSGGANGTTYRADGTAWRRISDQVMQGTLAARPAAAASNIGVLYLAVDIGSFFVSTGSAWTQSSVPQVSAYQSVAQSLSNSVEALISFTTEDYDLGSPSLNMHDNVNPENFWCRVAGLYAMTATVNFAVSAGGSRYAMLRKNGAGYFAIGVIASTVAALSASAAVSTQARLAVGDVIQVVGWQNSGGALNTAPGVFTSFQMCWISP